MNILLIDFGSTNTKVTLVDIEKAEIVGTGVAYTTVESDVRNGLKDAMARMERQTGPVHVDRTLACSSAAGGLRMIASGLVPELTAEAARLACLGAGAKLLRSYAYELTREDVQEIVALHPDIFLLTGGIDGGNAKCLLHNARMLADAGVNFPVIIAGNRSAAGECADVLSGQRVLVCPNVMPKFGELHIAPVQEKIRALFLENIVKAKGLSRETGLVDDILMPTPSAVLQALHLLADGTHGEAGFGELLAVDLGGATTDVYSIASGAPRGEATVLKGLPEPYEKRSVEGDIGMRYSARGIAEAAGMEKIAAIAGISLEETEAVMRDIGGNPSLLPETEAVRKVDFALAALAVETATLRHAGTIEEVYTPLGKAYAQTGKDLMALRRLILTGGALIHAERPEDIARHALYSAAYPASLRPAEAEIYLDEKYILAAMGLLAGYHPAEALTIMKKELVDHGMRKSAIG